MPPYSNASLAPTVELIDTDDSLLAYVGSTRRYVRLSGPAAIAAQALEHPREEFEPAADDRTLQALANAGVVDLAGYEPSPLGVFHRYRLRSYTLRLPLIQHMGWLSPLVGLVGKPLRTVRAVPLALVWMMVMTFASLRLEPNRAEGVFALLCLVVILAFHEMSHAVSAAAAGTMPRSIGLGLFLVIPVAYVDYTDVYRLSDADGQRVALAGPFADVISVGAIAMLAPWFGAAAFVTVPFAVALFNANPLVGSDVRKAARAADDFGYGRLVWAIAWAVPLLILVWRLV